MLNSIYKAVVIDNSTFYTKGTIRVRIAGMYNGKIIWDLSEKTDELQIGDGDNINFPLDYEAILFSPIGGGRNYGAYFLPQINEKGIIAFLAGNRKNPIWMGSIFEPTRDTDYRLERVNFPTDDPNLEGEDTDGIVGDTLNVAEGDIETALKKNFTLRTKTTTPESADTLNWQERRTSNIISFGDQDLKITHFAEEDGWDDITPNQWQEIKIHKDPDNEDADTIYMKVENVGDEKSAKASLTEDGFFITLTNGDTETTFNITSGEEGINLTDQFLNKIIGTEDGLEISTNDGEQVIKIVNGDQLQISIEGDVNLTASGTVNIDSDVNITGSTEAGGTESLVRYSELKAIIEAYNNHAHVAPSGPTSPPTDGTPAPLAPQLISDILNMETSKITSE